MSQDGVCWNKCELLRCPSCGGVCFVAISQGSHPKDTWRKHIVGCNGTPNPDENGGVFYSKKPCGLQITAYTDERDVSDLIKQWQQLPRATQ